MKVALSVWQGRIAPVFDVSQEMLVVEVDRGTVGARTTHPLPQGPAVARERLCAQLGVETLICGAISAPLAGALEGAGVSVIPFVAGTVDEVLEAFVAGALGGPAFSMPGCRGGRAGAPRGRGRRRGRHCGDW